MANLSGSITSGGTAQTIAAYSPTRRSLIIENISDTDMWIAFGSIAVADQPAFKVAAGELMTFGPEFRDLIVRSISVIGATTGKKFTAHDGSV